MSDLRELYQEVILDHGKKPRNFSKPVGCNREANGYNPLCGDKVTVYLRVNDGRIEDVGFSGAGCAISMASASLMSEVLKGKTVAEASALFERFRGSVMGKEEAAWGEAEDLDKLAVLFGVREFPMRVKCATLAWHTMAAAAQGKTEEVTTE
jgi:nitrogen fixation NifU-like protein